jgi:hypothetical protein
VNFFDVAGVGSCREGSSRRMGLIGTSSNAYGCGEGYQKGLGRIGLVLAEGEPLR